MAEPVYVRLSGCSSEVVCPHLQQIIISCIRTDFVFKVPSPSRMKPIIELPLVSPGPKFGVIVPTKIRRPKKKAAIPEPKWVEVTTELNKEQAEDRIFVGIYLRFILSVTLTIPSADPGVFPSLLTTHGR